MNIVKFFDEFEKQMLTAYDGVTKALKPYLPYNIYKNDKGNLVYEIAVAGFKRQNISITAHEDCVKITGNIGDNQVDYLHKGISSKYFDFTIPISPIYTIESANLADGILTVTFARSKKESAREIPIN
jgi:molecular chaperone IbpA